MNKKIITGEYKVVECNMLTDEIYSMWIEAPDIVKECKAGQFVSLYCDDGAHLLPRPISICDVDRGKGALRIVFRVVGYGTELFSKKLKGDLIRVHGPIGNGFSKVDSCRKPILIGGGIGIPPMLFLSKCIGAPKIIVSGYRGGDLFLQDEIAPEAEKAYVATDDGSSGTKGTVIDVLEQYDVSGDIVFACGPMPMLRGVKEWAAKKGIEAWLSMEERMACGVGACLGCVVDSTEVDGHSKVKNKRVCVDGPVFLSTDVEL